MTQQYLIGELSMRLEQLQAVAACDAVSHIAGLRREIETGPVVGLSSAAAQAITLADSLCWHSLACGDVSAFSRQAEVAAGLRLFGECARLLADG